jgi:hypothetical protein
VYRRHNFCVPAISRTDTVLRPPTFQAGHRVIGVNLGTALLYKISVRTFDNVRQGSRRDLLPTRRHRHHHRRGHPAHRSRTARPTLWQRGRNGQVTASLAQRVWPAERESGTRLSDVVVELEHVPRGWQTLADGEHPS